MNWKDNIPRRFLLQNRELTLRTKDKEINLLYHDDQDLIEITIFEDVKEDGNMEQVDSIELHASLVPWLELLYTRNIKRKEN